MSESTTQASPPGGGKKILGLPRQAVIFGGIALAAGLLWYVYRSRKAAASAASTTSGTTGAVDYSGDISTLQSEFGDLASEISALQGGGGTGGGGSGGTGPAGPPGPEGPAGPKGPAGPAGKTPAKLPTGKPVNGNDAHQKHLAHLAHLRHLVAIGKATPAQRAELAKG